MKERERHRTRKRLIWIIAQSPDLPTKQRAAKMYQTLVEKGNNRCYYFANVWLNGYERQKARKWAGSRRE